MKKLFLTLIGVAALALAAVQTSNAQGPSYSFATINSPMVIVGPTNLATPTSFFVGDRRNVAISMTVACGSAGATNQFFFAPSVDGTTYDTNAASLLSTSNILASAGTMTKVQNLDVLGYGYLELYTIDTKGNLLTTNTLKRSIKFSAP